MPANNNQEEENWDDDFEFGSSAGSPVLGSQPKGGDVTPPNLSPRALGRRRSTNSPGRNGNGNGNAFTTPPPSSKGMARWSSASFECWDDEDETINVQGFANLQQKLVTPKARPTLNTKPRTPTRASGSSNESIPFWDDELEAEEMARQAGAPPPSAVEPKPISKIFSSTAANTTRSPDVLLPPKSAFPVKGNGQVLNSSQTDTTTSLMDSSEYSATQPSDASATSTSVSTSQSGSFLGRLGRRLSKATHPKDSSLPLNGEKSSPNTQDPFSPEPFSPPSSSNALSPNPSNIFGSSPSKNKTPFTFGSGILKRSGSLSKSSNNTPPSDVPAVPALPRKSLSSRRIAKKSVTPDAEFSIAKNMPGVGLGADATNEGTRTAPAVFNPQRYPELPQASSHLQYASHVHSSASVSIPSGRNMLPGWGPPPSPTRQGKKRTESTSAVPAMLTSLMPAKKDRSPSAEHEKSADKAENSKATLPSQEESVDENARPKDGSEGKKSNKSTHHSSISSGNFFASIRKRSNPLHAMIPNSALISEPPSKASSRPEDSTTNVKNEQKDPKLHEPEVPEINSQPSNVQPIDDSRAQPVSLQAQARQRRAHRRNISTGAMITSVIDEVSSDATVTNKLSAVRARREPTSGQRSSLNQSTTASEIHRDDTASPSLPTLGRMSVYSNGISPPASPVEFNRSSEESNRSTSPPFIFPSSIAIRSPLLASGSPPGSEGLNRSGEGNSPSDRDSSVSAVTSQSRKLSGSLLPPIELCPPSPFETQTFKTSPPPNVPLKTTVKKDEAPTPGDEDADKTPVPLPRRRAQHLRIGTGNTLPTSSSSNNSLDKLDPQQQSRITNPTLPISGSTSTSLATTGSGISSIDSHTTLVPRASNSTKQMEMINGRTSPGISASLGRLSGASTVGKIESQGNERPGSRGLTRRNSLTGGTTGLTGSSTSSSLGGLKIPSRISQKQDALKRDLTAVREFALSIDELKKLQLHYETTLTQVKKLCIYTSEDAMASQESLSKGLYRMRAASPTPQYHLPRPPSIAGSEHGSSQPPTPVSPTFQDIPMPREMNRNIAPVADGLLESVQEGNEQKEQARINLTELENHYSIWWECAGLLIELGGAAPPATAGVSAATKTPTMTAPPKPRFGVLDNQSTPRPKDRHATLPTQAPPPIPSVPSMPSASASQTIDTSDSNTSLSRRRGSTGQQDLNARQVQLLKSMLNTPNPGDLSAALEPPLPYSSPYQGLSPVISHPSSTIRTVSGSSDLEKLKQQPTDQSPEVPLNKAKRRQRHISLAGKLGVKEILAGLKWAKEKAKQWPKPSVPPTPAKEEFPIQSDSRTSIDLASTRESIDQSGPVTNEIIATEPTHDSMASTPPQTQAIPPSPYKRSRRRSLASIFKFGNVSGSQSAPKSASRSRSRVDLTSPTAMSHHDDSSRYGGSRTDDQVGTDADSDWDHMNSPSDFPGRYGYQRNASVSNHDLSGSGSMGRGRVAPIGIPIGGQKSRRGSTVSRNQSHSRAPYGSASASNASLTGSSVFGSMPSHQSLHEALGMDKLSNDRSEDDRRKLKKVMKSPRRPPSAGGRKSRPSPSQDSPPKPLPYSSSPPVTSPIADRPYYSTHFTSHQSQVSLASSTRIPATPSTRSLHAPSQSPSVADLAQPRLALTPENIVPLLVYAREVKSQLADCIAELKALESDLMLSKV
ncbi:hypothetical protein CPB86DRAFT_740719 [Serendipita vermifera]|nr:hypothetical protein CPB86DRAFT_740719 [Serendipita vermifera]